MKVWKTILKAHGLTTAKVPRGSEAVHFAMQGGETVLWFSFDVADEGDLEDRTFEIVGTGQETKCGTVYVGTVIDEGGFVWHLFEQGFSAALHGVWIPFSTRSNAEETLRVIRSKSEGGLDGYCLDEKEGSCGVLLPFMGMADSDRAARGVLGRFGFHGIAVRASVNFDAKTIVISERSKKPKDEKAFDKSSFGRVMEKFFKQGDQK